MPCLVIDNDAAAAADDPQPGPGTRPRRRQPQQQHAAVAHDVAAPAVPRSPIRADPLQDDVLRGRFDPARPAAVPNPARGKRMHDNALASCCATKASPACLTLRWAATVCAQDRTVQPHLLLCSPVP